MTKASTSDLKSDTGWRKLPSREEAANLPEGLYAAGLGEIAKAHPGASIGSYPSFTAEGMQNRIVVRAKDATVLSAARDAVVALVERRRSERTVPASEPTR